MRGWEWDDLAAALTTGEAAAESDRLAAGLAVAYLNLAEGRLHRAGELSGADGFGNVAALLQATEEQLAAGTVDGSLLPVLERVARGEGVTRRACGQVAYLSDANILTLLTRWENGVESRTLLAVPPSQSFPWLITEVHPSPDYRILALESCSPEGGGPVLLLDVNTGEWVNANREYGLALSESGEPHPQDESAQWQVVGWHPGSGSLLLAVEAQNLAFWLDLEAGRYQRISLADTGESIGGERHLALLPDGSGLAYVNDDGHRLMAYDFGTGERTELLRVEDDAGRINYPRFCPGGDRIAYMAAPETGGGRRQCSLEVVTLADGSRETLAEDSLCLDSPRWSAEGASVGLRKQQGKTDSTWMLDPISGEYVASALDYTSDCWLPTFARAEIARVTSMATELPAEWTTAVGAVVSEADSAQPIP